MSYFGNGTLENCLLDQARYVQQDKGASNIEMIEALAKVIAYFVEKEKESQDETN